MWQSGVAAALTIGVAHIIARYGGKRAVAGVLKAIPIALLAALVATEPAAISERYRWLVFAGLICSLAGDVWLVFPGGFVRGLASFLLAHLLYIGAFGAAGDQGLLLVPFAAFGAAMLAYLWPHLARDRAPVAVYVTVIVVMGWRAAARSVGAAPWPSGELALAGALFFMVSDGVLAVNRFARPFAAADGAVMTTYYVAQTLIALSVRA